MLDTTITPITYKEAATLLLTGEGQIRTSVSNGLFTRLPTIGMKQTLIKEQVELFIGKKQIRLTLLSHDEMELWQHYRHIAENTSVNTSEHKYSQEEVAKLIASTVQHMSTMSEDEKKTVSVVSSWLANKTEWSILDGLALIVFALGYYWYMKHKEDITTKLEEVANEIPAINEEKTERIITSLKKLGDNPDVNTVIETFIEEAA